jgi:hypothetical protein
MFFDWQIYYAIVDLSTDGESVNTWHLFYVLEQFALGDGHFIS